MLSVIESRLVNGPEMAMLSATAELCGSRLVSNEFTLVETLAFHFQLMHPERVVCYFETKMK